MESNERGNAIAVSRKAMPCYSDYFHPLFHVTNYLKLHKITHFT